MGTIRGGLAVTGGRITQVGSDVSLPEAASVVDAQGKLVLPGVIDPHTHLHSIIDQSQLFSDAIKTESVSASVSGITTVVSTPFVPTDMQKQLPKLREQREEACKNSFIDFKFNTIIFYDSHIEEMAELTKEGFSLFKFLMGYAKKEAKALGLAELNWALFYRGAEMIAKVGPPAIQLIHCEEPEIGLMLIERLKNAGRTDLAAWDEARPAFTEGIHAFSAGLIADHLNSPLYIVHVASKESLEALDYLRNKGVNVWGETCTHYLSLTKDSNLGSLAKCSPPLRGEAVQAELWKALARGTLQTVGSDQCLFPREAKEKGIWEAPPGTGMMGSVFPVMMTDGVNKGRITIERLVELCAENPARVFGMYPQKGVLSPGSDGDIIIVDPDKEWVITNENLKTALEFCSFEGYKAKGKVLKTFVRGKLVAEDGDLVAQTPQGRYV
jgi:dihydroorotase-like cyclic amidohydrolase